MSGRGRGRGVGSGRGRGQGLGRGAADTGTVNPAHQALDPPNLLYAFYAPSTSGAVHPPDHPLWQDVSFHAAARAPPTMTRPPAPPAPRAPEHAAPLSTDAAQGLPAPPREAKPWSNEEDALIIQMHVARAQNQDTQHTYNSIASSIGRSSNAVKCRWQNKLKVDVAAEMQAARAPV